MRVAVARRPSRLSVSSVTRQRAVKERLAGERRGTSGEVGSSFRAGYGGPTAAGVADHQARRESHRLSRILGLTSDLFDQHTDGVQAHVANGLVNTGQRWAGKRCQRQIV